MGYDSAMTLSPEARTKSSRWMLFLLPLLLCVADAAVFWPSLRASFVNWDDDLEIVLNHQIEGYTVPHFAWWWTNYSWTRRYQPLDWMSWALDYQIAGRSPFVFHLHNLLQHMVCTVLLFFLVMTILRRWRPGTEERALAIGAALGTLWWAVHPLRAQVVAWATGRVYTQCTMLLLVMFLCYFLAQEARTPGRRRVLYWVAVAAFAGALLSYSIVVGAAVVVLLLDVYPLRRIGTGTEAGWWSAKARRVYVEKIPFFLVAFLVGAATLYARYNVTERWDPPPTLAQFPLYDRVMQGFYVYARYLWLPWIPVHLSPLYTRLAHFDPNEGAFWGSAVVVVGITVFSVMLRKRAPWVGVLWTFYLLMLFPLLGHTEHPYSPSDRYAQMATLAYAVLLAGGVVFALTRGTSRLRAAVPLGLAGISVVFGVLCFQQTQIWMNDRTLFTHILAELGNDPGRADPLWRLGRYELEQGDAGEALKLADESLAIQPDVMRAMHVRGNALLDLADRARDAHQAEATQLYMEAGNNFDREAKLFHRVEALRLAAYAYQEAGRLEVAEDRLRRALAVDPSDPVTQADLARVLGAKRASSQPGATQPAG